MRELSWMNFRVVMLACLLAAATAVPVWSDTIIFRNGSTMSGTLTAADVNSVTFTDRNGVAHRYSVRDVDAVHFSDAQDQPGGAPAAYAPPVSNPRDDQSYGNDQNSANQANSGYDEARMERVVIPAGTDLALRTNEHIDSRDSAEGQTYSAEVAEDVRDADGSVVIPRGSGARLITRRLEGNGDITLDVESVTVAGRRYRVSTVDQELQGQRQGVGANKRTGQYVGGGAVLGAIIGAIAGGGKGAAIGAVAGAGAGAGTEIITQGKEVHVPAETVLRFRLDRPLRLHLWS